MQPKINELALLDRAKGIQSLFSKKVLNTHLIEGEASSTDYQDIYVSLDIVKALLEQNKPIEALRVFRSDVAHENGHNYITLPDKVDWEKWYGQDPIKKMIENIIEDRRVDFAVAKRYRAYMLAKKTLDSFILAQAESKGQTQSKTLEAAIEFQNAFVLGTLIGKVPNRIWNNLSKEAQKAILECKDILDGRHTNGKEGNKTKYLPVELVYDFNVLMMRANKIYDLTLPFFQNPAQSQKSEEQSSGQGEDEGGEAGIGTEKSQENGESSGPIAHVVDKGTSSSSEKGGGQQEGRGGQAQKSGQTGESSQPNTHVVDETGGSPTAPSSPQGSQSGGLTDLSGVPHENYADVQLPKADKENPNTYFHKPKHGIPKFVIIKLKLNAEEFEKFLQQFNADKEPTSSEIKDVQIIFGIDLSKELLEKMAKARQDLIQQLFKEHKIDIPESNFEKYQGFRDSEVNLQIAKLSRVILEDTRLKRKIRTVESGGLLSPTFLSQYFARDTDLFTERIRSHRSVSWAILIDVSGSVTEEEVIKTFEVLADVGSKVCGEDKLLLATFDHQYHLVKDFSEKVDQVVKGRIGNSYSGGSTNICCSIEKTAYRLSKTLAEKKVLILVSDGYQNTCEKGQQYEHLPVAVANARKMGIIPIHINLGCEIKGMYKIEIESLSELADKFIQLYRSLAQIRRR